VNITLTGQYIISQLLALSNRNESVLVLSSFPFYLKYFTSSEDILIPKPSREEEALIYLGSCICSECWGISIHSYSCQQERQNKGQRASYWPKYLFLSLSRSSTDVKNFGQNIEQEKQYLTFTTLDHTNHLVSVPANLKATNPLQFLFLLDRRWF
jgi:hypothetical protein